MPDRSNKMSVTWFQVMLLFLAIRITGFAVLLPDITSSPTPTRDAWMVPFLVVPATLLIGFMAIKLGNRFPGQTLIEYGKALTGPFFGTIITLLYAWWFIGFAALNLRLSSEFFLTAFLPTTPISVIIGTIALTAAYAARMGYKVLARVTQVLGPIVVTLVWLLMFLSLNQFNLQNFTPILAHGIKPLFLSSLAPFAIFSDIVNIAMIMPYMTDPSKAWNSVKWSVLLSGLHSMIMSGTLIAILGIDCAQDIAFPGLSIARQIDIANIFQRIEVAIMVIWLGGVFVRVALALIMASLTIAQGLNLKKYEPLVVPVTLVSSAVAFLFGDNSLEVGTALQARIITPYYITFSVAIPLILLLLSYIKSLHRPGPSAAMVTAGETNSGVK